MNTYEENLNIQSGIQQLNTMTKWKMMDNALAKIKRQNGKQISTKYYTDGYWLSNKYLTKIWRWTCPAPLLTAIVFLILQIQWLVMNEERRTGLQLRQTERQIDIASVTRIRGGNYFNFTTIATSSVTSLLVAAHLIGNTNSRI